MELPTNQMDSTREEANTNKNNAKKTDFKRNDFQSSELNSFTGETPELDLVLSLLSEKVDKGVTFDVFQERLKNHVIKNFNKAEDVTSLITELTDPMTDFELNNAPANFDAAQASNQMEVKKWEMRYKMYLNCEETLRENITKIYGLTIGQCTPALRSTLKSDPDYKNKSSTYDSLWLLQKLRVLTAGVDTAANPSFSLNEQILFFFNTRQGQNESDDDYLMRFNSRTHVLEMSGRDHMFLSEKVLGKAINTASDIEIAESREKFRVMCFLQRADKGRYGELLDDLKKGMFVGRDEYPTTVARAYDLLLHTSKKIGYRRNRQRYSQGQRNGGQSSFAFTQKADKNANHKNEDVAGMDGVLHEGVRCYQCQRQGHYSSQCPDNEGKSKVGHTMSQQQTDSISKSWILLDSCSTHSISNNRNLLKNLEKCRSGESLVLTMNAGHMEFGWFGDFVLFPLKLHFNEQSLATILSLREVGNIPGVRIYMDTEK